MSVLSFNPPSAASAASVRQVEDGGEMTNFLSINEAYGVLCLVLGSTRFKFSKMEEFTHWDRREDMEFTFDIRMSMVKSTGCSNL